MGGKREKPEDIVVKLRQVEVLQGQGKLLADAVRQIGVTVQIQWWAFTVEMALLSMRCVRRLIFWIWYSPGGWHDGELPL